MRPTQEYMITPCDECGENIYAGDTFYKINLNGDEFVFCSKGCRDEYFEDRTEKMEGEDSESYIESNGDSTFTEPANSIMDEDW